MIKQTFFLHQQFQDFDAFCESARNWDLDYRQLDPGRYSSELLMFGDAATLFTRAKIRRSMLQKGASPSGLVTFGLLAKADISIHWRNIDIQGNSLFIFPPDGELHSITDANFDVFTLSIDEKTLDQICAVLELPNFRKLIRANEVFSCSPELIMQLKGWLHDFALRLVNGGATENGHTRLLQLREDLARFLVTALAESTEVLSKLPIRKRDKALKLAIGYIEESDYPVSSVQELCSLTNVSWRTLEYAFRERYGLSPKTYIITHHLNSVRKALRLADPNAATISEISSRHGFWHMSQFAANYKRLFGELPSDTLRNK